MKVLGKDLHSSGYDSKEYYIKGKDFLNIINPYYKKASSKYDPTIINGKILLNRDPDREIIRDLEREKIMYISESIAERVLNNLDLLYLLA